MNFFQYLLTVEGYQSYCVIKMGKSVEFDFGEFGVEDSGG